MKYFDTFSGIGGFALGIERAMTDAECIGFSEIDKYAKEIYLKHFNHRDYGDIRFIRGTDLPDFDLFCGGFPCQTFSIAGKRAGFKDQTKGTLFFEIARILSDKRPRYLLLENVKGLLTHDDGKTFITILRVLTDIGYDLQWTVLNSKDFGVPQNRERVYIIGNLRGERRPEIFSFKESDGSYNRFQKTKQIHAGTLTARYPANWEGNYIALTEKRTEEAKKIRRETKGYSPRRGKQLEPRSDNLANTLTAGQSKEGFLTDGMYIRRLTPIECERLQGFPDNWTEGISDSQRYKCLGNAVTVNVIGYIINLMNQNEQT